MKTASIIIVIIIILIGGILFISNKEGLQNTGGEDVISDANSSFDKAPQFSLSDFGGDTVSLADSAGKVRVVNVWATWCPFCVDELPDFGRLQEEFSDEIVVIAIDRAESLEKAKGFSDELGITDSMTMLLDPKDSFYKSIGGFSMPETLFIDGDGNIRIHKRGPMEFEEMKEKVESILNG